MPLLGTRGAASAQGFGEFAQSGPATYIEDVFSTYLYTGNGSTQTIVNGIDLATKGGLIWSQIRSGTIGANNGALVDTVRGINSSLVSNSTSGATGGLAYSDTTSFNTNGFSLGYVTALQNRSGNSMASWTFRKQPKFFDVVTYTGTGSVRTVAHNLASVPGCIIIKRTDTTSNWFVYHREMDFGVGAAGYSMNLNLTDTPSRTSNTLNDTNPTATVFTLGTNAMVNASGGTYVAYLFAHNAGGFGLSGADNVISCGITGSNGAGLGFEPQWVLYKDINYISDWYLFDNMRGVATGGTDAVLFPNSSSAENSGTNWIDFNATGFSGGVAGRIYIAIRRGPMKTPTSGTSVYTGSLAGPSVSINAGFPPDMAIAKTRDNGIGGSSDTYNGSRLMGNSLSLSMNTTSAEGAYGWQWDRTTNTFMQTSVGSPVINWLFRRAPSFMDVVCYTGNGANRTLNHNLGVVPELMIVKARSVAGENWVVYHSALGATKGIILNSASASFTYSGNWNNTAPTSTLFTVGTETSVNRNNATFVNYLFASCPGVSKVGSYTGTGGTQTISCGFAARFVMIKRTDSAGDWWVWDTARGMVAGTDPRLALNLTSAETNANWVYTNASGFQIVTTDASVNASGGTYIYLAIA